MDRAQAKRATVGAGAFAGVLGSSRGSEREAVENSDVIEAFAGGHDLSNAEIRSLSVDLESLHAKIANWAGRWRQISFLLDRQYLLAVRMNSQTRPRACEIITRATNPFNNEISAASSPECAFTVKRVSESAFLTYLSKSWCLRQALVATGLAEREHLLARVRAGLTERQHQYLQALAQAPGTDMYVLGAPINGHRQDKTERSINGLLDLGLLISEQYPVLTLNDDGVTVASL